MEDEFQDRLKKKVENKLVNFLTKYSDYLCDQKYFIKDVALSRQFLEPFTWKYVDLSKLKLGNSISLLETVLKSDAFWQDLK